MKGLASFLCVFLTVLSANATVPYGHLEILRRQSVVTRVALDNPEDTIVKSCGIKVDSFAGLGAKLQSRLDEAATQWQELSLTIGDMPSLKEKTAVCKYRGSCQVYERFLSSVIAPEEVKLQITEMQKSLEVILESLEASHYKKALKTVPEPCKYLIN